MIPKHNQFLRNKVEEMPDTGGGNGPEQSLSDRMAGMSFTFGEETGNVVQPPPETKPDGAGDEVPDEEEEEEEFPQLGELEKKPDAVVSKDDEAGYDAQTAAILAKLEEKNHPGDVYKALRAELKAGKARAKELELRPVSAELPETIKTELETLRAAAAEVEALRQRNSELLKVNDRVAVEESEAFINEIRNPIAEMEEVVTALATAAGVSADELFNIIDQKDITKQDKALDELHKKFGTRMGSRIERMCDDWKILTKKREQMFANAPKTLAADRAAQEKRAQDEAALRSGAFKASTKGSFEKFAARVPGFTDAAGAMTDLAKSIADKTASIDPSTLSPADLGFMAFTANSFPEMRKAVTRLEKENALLRAGKSPGAALGDPQSRTAAKKDEVNDEETFSERMAKAGNFTFSG